MFRWFPLVAIVGGGGDAIVVGAAAIPAAAAVFHRFLGGFVAVIFNQYSIDTLKIYYFNKM